jgi:hypothetical protein
MNINFDISVPVDITDNEVIDKITALDDIDDYTVLSVKNSETFIPYEKFTDIIRSSYLMNLIKRVKTAAFISI